MEKTKTECAGRYLVDVPSQAEVSLSGEMIAGFTIDTVEESEAECRERLASREAEIVARGTDTDTEQPGGLVVARDLRAAGVIGRTFVYGRDHAYGFEDGRRVDSEWVSVESHAHLNKLSLTLSMKYASEGKAKTAEELLARLRSRNDDEIPSVPGFCIARAVFAEPLPAHMTEHIVMHVGFPNHAEVAMTLVSLPGGRRSRSLLTRYADMDAEASAVEMLRVSKLRSEKRTINGLVGQEVLERVLERNFAATYGFVWETQGVSDDPVHPYLSLELHGGISPAAGGQPVDTSLRQDAVLALWDHISSSIRPATPVDDPLPPHKPATSDRG